MDTGEGIMITAETKEKLEELAEKYPKAGGVFEVGEILEIKGSKFKVHDISPFGIKLKLLKREE